MRIIYFPPCFTWNIMSFPNIQFKKIPTSREFGKYLPVVVELYFLEAIKYSMYG